MYKRSQQRSGRRSTWLPFTLMGPIYIPMGVPITFISRGKRYSHQSTTMKRPCILYVGTTLSTRGNRFNLRLVPVLKSFLEKFILFLNAAPPQTVVVLLRLVNIREFPGYKRKDAHNKQLWLDTRRCRSTCVSSHTSLMSGNIQRKSRCQKKQTKKPHKPQYYQN